MSHHWDIHDLSQAYGSTDGAMPAPTVPAKVTQLSHGWGAATRITRKLLRQIYRLGYTIADYDDDSVTLTDVGLARMTLTLRHTGQTPIDVHTVTFGQLDWDAADATRWLAARTPR